MNEGNSSLNVPERILSFVVSSDNYRFVKELNHEEYETWITHEKSTGRICLAKKFLIDRHNELEVHRYYQEVITISEIDDPFVASLVGFTVKYPFFIYTEYLKNSSLYEALHIYTKSYPLTGTHLSTIAMGIAHGMEKIHEAKMIEPYLCTANIFLTSEFLPKICHFNTLSEPLKWRAPELTIKVSRAKYNMGTDDSYRYDRNSDLYKADVFNYGLILYELLTKKDSFDSMTYERAIELVSVENKRPTIPKGTPLSLAKLIKSCWSPIPEKRPTFSEIYDYFESGEVHFSHTDAKVVDVLSRRIKRYQKTITNKSIEEDFQPYSPSRSRSPVSNHSLTPRPRRTPPISNNYELHTMTPSRYDNHHHRHRSVSRNDFKHIEDNQTNNNQILLSPKVSTKRRHNSVSREKAHYFTSSLKNNKLKALYDSSSDNDNSFSKAKSSENDDKSESSDESSSTVKPLTKTRNRDITNDSPKRKHKKKQTSERIKMNRNIDLQVFQNYRNSEFFSSLHELPNIIHPSQYRQFFKIISKHFSSDCPQQVIFSICDTIQKLFKDQEAIKSFTSLNIHLFLPIDDPQLIENTFEILYSLFDYNSLIFQNDFTHKMSLLIVKNPEKSLTLLSIFAKSFNKMEQPWPLLDLLFDYENLYYRSNVGCDYITLLFFLNFNFTSFHQARMGRTRPVLIHFLNSTDKNAVFATYRAICALYDKLFKIPMEIMVQDLIDDDLSFQAISVMLRMKDSDLVPHSALQNKSFRRSFSLSEVILPLLKISESHNEATIVLLKFAKNIEAAKFLLSKPIWLTKKLPTIQDTLKVFLTVMTHASLRDAISTIDVLAEFFTYLIKSKDPMCVIALRSILKRLSLEKKIISNLIERNFFNHLLNSFSTYRDDNVTISILNIISYLAAVSESAEYLKFSDHLKNFIWCNNANVAHNAFTCLYTLSFYPRCARLFKEMNLDKDVTEVFVSENENQKVQEFLKNLEKVESND